MNDGFQALRKELECEFRAAMGMVEGAGASEVNN